MKSVILAGGFGIRISEESSIKHKPMVESGQAHPLAYHENQLYGVNDFVVCCGYKSHVEWLGGCPRIGVKTPVNQIIHQETGSIIT